MNQDTSGLDCLERAFDEGHAEITGKGRNQRIRYIAAGRSERWSDPEERVGNRTQSVTLTGV